ncbi:MAG: hypothetical protein RL357_1033, partial [Pseudomonadota bacterium]
MSQNTGGFGCDAEALYAVLKEQLSQAWPQLGPDARLVGIA